jgi:hypothetical protein
VFYMSLDATFRADFEDEFEIEKKAEENVHI